MKKLLVAHCLRCTAPVGRAEAPAGVEASFDRPLPDLQLLAQREFKRRGWADSTTL